MHVRNMILCLATVFLLAVVFVWATFDPDLTAGQTSELIQAYDSYKSLNQQGRYAEAEPYAEAALREVTKEFGPNDPNTAALLEILAQLHQNQGRYKEAVPLYRRALAIWEEDLGPDHPEVAERRSSYAALLRETEPRDRAEGSDSGAGAIRATNPALAAEDIASIITTYYEDVALFERDYLGRPFESTMFFGDVGGAALGGGYFLGFEGLRGSAGLTCVFPEALPDGVDDWDAGFQVSLRGVVFDVALSRLYLNECRFN